MEGRSTVPEPLDFKLEVSHNQKQLGNWRVGTNPSPKWLRISAFFFQLFTWFWVDHLFNRVLIMTQVWQEVCRLCKWHRRRRNTSRAAAGRGHSPGKEMHGRHRHGLAVLSWGLSQSGLDPLGSLQNNSKKHQETSTIKLVEMGTRVGHFLCGGGGEQWTSGAKVDPLTGVPFLHFVWPQSVMAQAFSGSLYWASDSIGFPSTHSGLAETWRPQQWVSVLFDFPLTGFPPFPFLEPPKVAISLAPPFYIQNGMCENWRPPTTCWCSAGNETWNEPGDSRIKETTSRMVCFRVILCLIPFISRTDRKKILGLPLGFPPMLTPN